ncbi:MAG: helix-hairpin-helix domain-containing protein [Planctomycetota bacterium]
MLFFVPTLLPLPESFCLMTEYDETEAEPASQARETRVAAWLSAGFLLCVVCLGLSVVGTKEKASEAIEHDIQLILDLNLATEAQLRALPDIGPQMAARIILDREENGEFQSVDNLARVRGMGPTTLNALRPFLTTSRTVTDADLRLAKHRQHTWQERAP